MKTSNHQKKQQKTGEEPFKLSCGAGRYERGETL
jgi:hypothetical protein